MVSTVGKWRGSEGGGGGGGAPAMCMERVTLHTLSRRLFKGVPIVDSQVYGLGTYETFRGMFSSSPVLHISHDSHRGLGRSPKLRYIFRRNNFKQLLITYIIVIVWKLNYDQIKCTGTHGRRQNGKRRQINSCNFIILVQKINNTYR